MEQSAASRGWRMAPINSSPLYWAVAVCVDDGTARDGRRITHDKEQKWIFTQLHKANKASYRLVFKRQFALKIDLGIYIDEEWMRKCTPPVIVQRSLTCKGLVSNCLLAHNLFLSHHNQYYTASATSQSSKHRHFIFGPHSVHQFVTLSVGLIALMDLLPFLSSRSDHCPPKTHSECWL